MYAMLAALAISANPMPTPPAFPPLQVFPLHQEMVVQKYEWVVIPTNPDQYALMNNGVQVGAWSRSGDYYRSIMSDGTWGDKYPTSFNSRTQSESVGYSAPTYAVGTPYTSSYAPQMPYTQSYAPSYSLPSYSYGNAVYSGSSCTNGQCNR